MRSISIEELRSEVEAYIEAAKSASGDSAVRYLNRAETALRSYDGVPERFKNTYFRLIEDIRNDLEQQICLVGGTMDLFSKSSDIQNGVSGHVETVVLLSQLKQKPDDYINVTIELDDMDITSAETKAIYDEIKRVQLWRH